MAWQGNTTGPDAIVHARWINRDVPRATGCTISFRHRVTEGVYRNNRIGRRSYFPGGLKAEVEQ